MTRITIHNADDSSTETLELPGDRVVLPELGPGWLWVGIAGYDSAPVDLLTPRSSFAVGLQADAPHRSWVVETDEAAQCTLRLPDKLSDDERIDCFVATLPHSVKQIADSAANPSEVAGAVASVLEGAILGRSPEQAPYAGLDPSAAFDLLVECIRIARRLRAFRGEAVLIERALALRPSRNLQRLLSLAYAHAQDYRRSTVEAERALQADPSLADGPFGDHLAELRAFHHIGDELRSPSSPKTAADGKERIAYCLHNSLPYQHGGYAMRSHAIAKALRARGHNLIGFGRPGFPTDGSVATTTPAPARQVTVDDVPYRFENCFGRRGRAYGYLDEAADYYERVFIESEVGVVHAATNFWTALPAGLAARRLDLPFIYEVRSFWAITREAREPGFRDTPQAWRDEILETITLALADHVVTLNAAMREHLVHYGVEGASTSLVPNCVDGNVYSPRPRDSDLAATYGLGKDDVVIGYMGAMLGYEGLDLLVEAVISMIEAGHRVKLIIVGADSLKRTQPGTIEFDLETRIAACGIPGSIILADRIAPDSVPAHYGLFDICAYPRRDFEVCNLVSPLKPLEAMACGKAIVASDVGGMRGMVEDGKTGLVHAANDMADLQRRLSTLVTDREMRLRLGQSARSFAVAERSWDEVARSMSDAYASAAAAHAQGMDSARRDRLAAAWRELSG